MNVPRLVVAQPRSKVRLSVLRVYREPALRAPEPCLYWCYCPRCEEPHEGYATDPRGRFDVQCAVCREVFSIPTRALLGNG